MVTTVKREFADDVPGVDGKSEVSACVCAVVRLFGGLIQDIKRKAPFYLSDFKDGMSLQCVASFLFLYCACMSPVITFGGLLGEATEGRIVRAHASHCQYRVLCCKHTTVFRPCASERHRVPVWGLHDWSGLLSVCRAAAHHSGQHRPRAGF